MVLSKSGRVTIVDMCFAAAFNHIPEKGDLIFQVLVLGHDLDLSHARALLEVNGNSPSVAAGELTDAPIGASAQDRDAHLGRLYGALYSLPRKRLLFRFEQPCDPFARYVLTLGGIKAAGTMIEPPPVAFEPYKEWRPIPFD